MNNINIADIILAALWALWTVHLINVFKVKERLKRLFNKKDNNKLPVDYHCVHSLLDDEVKRLAKKHGIKLTFNINDERINSHLPECGVSFFGANYNHDFSFGFFGNTKNLQKKTSVYGLKRSVMLISSNLEDKLVNFLILDKLVSLNKKIDETTD